MPVAELFRALGDPTRLEIVQRLSSGSQYTITTVSKGLDISRQGVRKHLQILVKAKLVKLESKGRDTFVLLETQKLLQAQAFITELGRKWDKRLEKLRNFVEEK